MPTLKDILKLICATGSAHGLTFGEQCARDMEMEIRKHWPSERVYIPPADSRVDSDRARAIVHASKHLPTSAVAERFGVSRQLIAYHVRKRR